MVQVSINKTYLLSTNHLAPSKPIIIATKWAARYITVHWKLDEPTYVDHFSLILNSTRILIFDKTARSFNYTNNILPNRQ